MPFHKRAYLNADTVLFRIPCGMEAEVRQFCRSQEIKALTALIRELRADLKAAQAKPVTNTAKKYKARKASVSR